MAKIRPFSALRPSEAFASDVAALPYDVFSREEAVLFVKDRPLSFLNIDRPETQFDESVDTYDPRVYVKAAEMIEKETADGIFVREDKPCYYIYALTMGGRTQTGLVACSSVDDYENNIIKKHENTRTDKELDRMRHVDVTSAQTGPIFLAYRDDSAINALIDNEKLESPLFDFTAEDGIRHTVWRISDDTLISALTCMFHDVRNTYIADGHHRAASAMRVAKMRREAHPDYDGSEEFNYFLSVLFPESELKIFDYNRVVADLNGLTPETFLEAVAECFDITEAENDASPFRPRKKSEFGMFLCKKWYILNAKPAVLSDDPIKGLDVSILQDHLLGPILGILDPKTDSRIAFVGGIRGLKELEKDVAVLNAKYEKNGEKEKTAVAFSMFPTSMNELFTVADAGLLMPPKSTWFEPKLRSGLFIHTFEK